MISIKEKNHSSLIILFKSVICSVDNLLKKGIILNFLDNFFFYIELVKFFNTFTHFNFKEITHVLIKFSLVSGFIRDKSEQFS